MHTKKFMFYLLIEQEGQPDREEGNFTTEGEARTASSARWNALYNPDSEDVPSITVKRRVIETNEKPKRPRFVYPTSEIPHLWAHQTQGEAHNPQGNLFFKGPTIYSYRETWPLAHIYRKRNRTTLVLTNAKTYSHTTSGHQHAVNMAARHLEQIAVKEPTIPDFYSRKEHARMHRDNLKALHAEIAKHYDKASRALILSNVEWRQTQAQDRYADILRYCAFFNIKTKQAPRPDFTLPLERVRSFENPDPIRDAKRYKAKVRRDAQHAARAEKFRAYYLIKHEQAVAERAANIPAWRNGENVSLHLHGPEAWSLTTWQRETIHSLSLEHDDLPVMLRVNGENIETSLGATLPVSHAPRLWKLIRLVMQSRKPYEKNGHTEHAGHFAIDHINPDGTVTIGCHVVKFDEIERLAGALGLSSCARVPE